MVMLLFLELLLCVNLAELAFSVDICLYGLITSQAMINRDDRSGARIVVFSIQQHLIFLNFICSVPEFVCDFLNRRRWLTWAYDPSFLFLQEFGGKFELLYL